MNVKNYLHRLGCARTQEGHLSKIRDCLSDPINLSTLCFLFPITSIFLGVGRFRDVRSKKSDHDTFFRKTYYISSGIIAALGLGCIIAALRITLSIAVLIFACIGYTLDKILSKICNGNKGRKVKEVILSPLRFINLFFNEDEYYKNSFFK